VFLVDKLPHDSGLFRGSVEKLVKSLHSWLFFVRAGCSAAELFCDLAMLYQIYGAHLGRGSLDYFFVELSAFSRWHH